MDEISNELDFINLGDKRVNKRAKQILEKLYKGAGEGLSASFSGSDEIKAAYRWFDNDLVHPNKILEPHHKKTIERIKMHKLVGFVQDTTDIDMKHMEQVENLGVLNDTARPGCSLHPVIAFTPEKLCLGVLDAKFIIRPPEELGKKGSNNSRNIEDKESYRWIQGYRVVCHIAEQCPETLCVCIGDRESDIYELFLERGKADFLVRAWHDRGMEMPISEENSKLIEENNRLKEENRLLAEANEKLRKRRNSKNIPEIVEARKKNSDKIKVNRELIKENQSAIRDSESVVNKFKHQLYHAPIIGDLQFELPGRAGKKPRMVNQIIKAKEVTFLPSGHKQDLPKVSMNAVLLQEENPPAGEQAVIWILLTSLAINTFEDIQLIINLYLSRWGIELFFKVLKSGCKIEELRFQDASRLLACISIYMVVAWRILYSTFIGRVCPELPCSMLFERDEWQSVYAVVNEAKPPTEAPSLGKFMKWIATLGGYRGRKSDGPPGMKVIWIGMQAMHRLAEGWRAREAFG
jgi:Transposase Tn5 dimerisation domain/Transposase DNA-binding/Transposase DDE domain